MNAEAELSKKYYRVYKTVTFYCDVEATSKDEAKTLAVDEPFDWSDCIYDCEQLYEVDELSPDRM